MPIEVLMPALLLVPPGEGNLAKWHKRRATASKSGDVIARFTRHATMDVEAVDEGHARKILVPRVPTIWRSTLPSPVVFAKARMPRRSPTVQAEAATTNAAEGRQAELVREGAEAPRRLMPIRASNARSSAPPATAASVSAGSAEESEYLRHRNGDYTVREALRDAMGEETRRDHSVFVMGEEVGGISGVVKVTQGCGRTSVSS